MNESKESEKPVDMTLDSNLDVKKKDDAQEIDTFEGIPSALSTLELLKRRKQRLSSLIGMYKDQYWLLLDELWNKRKEFKAQGEEVAGKPQVEEERKYQSTMEYYSKPSTSGARNGEASKEKEEIPGIPSFSDVESAILSDKIVLDSDKVTSESLKERRSKASKSLSKVARLEKSALSVFSRRANRHGALACLLGKNATFYITRPEISVGRSTKSQLVDLDFAAEGKCNKISRQQGIIKLNADGSFYFQNFGQRKIKIDNQPVSFKRKMVLKNGSFIEVGGLRFIFLVNTLVRKAPLEVSINRS